MNKKVFTFILMVLSFSAMADDDIWLNKLECSVYIEYSNCVDIKNAVSGIKINDYQKIIFDNQLKKITFLMHKDRVEIASKKYDYFISLLEDSVPSEEFNKINRNKLNIYNLLLNYSKSSEYTPNPKYKIN